MTHIGKSVVFDGELTSDEDLRFDGTFKGHLHVRDATVTIGEFATIKADIRARQVVVQGTVRGLDRRQPSHRADRHAPR